MNGISKYILKKMKERRPDDTIYQLAKRCLIPDGTMRNMLNAPNAWVQATYLMRICADLGISMASAILAEDTEYDKDKELNHWKEKFFQTDNEKTKLTEENKKLKAALKELL